MWSVLLASFASPALAADCPDDPIAEVRSAADDLESAFTQLDDAGFDAAKKRLDAAIPCVTTPLELRDVLGLHRAEALAAFVDGDMVASKKSWGAVRILNPSWTPPDSLAPPGHLLRQLFEQAPTDTDTQALELAPDGGWLVDGRRGDAVPADRAFVLQGIDKDGNIVYTGYDRSLAEVPLLDFTPPGPSPKGKKMRLFGSIAGDALALAAGGAAYAHFNTASHLDTVPYDKFDSTVTAGNVAGWSAIVLGAGAVGLTTGAWAVKW